MEDKLAGPSAKCVLLARNTRAKNQRGYLTYSHSHRVEQTSWKFHPDQDRKLTRTVQISPKQKAFLEEFTALVWFNTPNSICPVTTYGKAGTRLVPAPLKARGPTGSALNRLVGRQAALTRAPRRYLGKGVLRSCSEVSSEVDISAHVSKSSLGN